MSDVVHIIVEALKTFFYSILWSFVLFNLGRLVLLLCTFGRYPRGRTLELHSNRICFVGLLFLVCVWAGIAGYNNYSVGAG